MKNLINKDNGANFLKADLHTHTPSDPHFTFQDFDPNDRKEEFARIYVDQLIEKGMDIIGVTEHNSVEWIEILKDAAKETSLKIFPGFEISANSGSSGVHLICLFNPETDKDTLDDIITQLGLPRGERFFNNGSCKSCEKDLDEVIEFILD
ncbi:MAG: PHP domain-containing protein, partial [Candidatus Woesearchaeota archaeon]